MTAKKKATKAAPAETTADQRLRFVGFQIEGYVSASGTAHAGDVYIEQEVCYDLEQAKDYATECDDDTIYALVKISERIPGWKDAK